MLGKKVRRDDFDASHMNQLCFFYFFKHWLDNLVFVALGKRLFCVFVQGIKPISGWALVKCWCPLQYVV